MTAPNPQMTKDDYQSVRNFLRWAAIGVTPSATRAVSALEILGAYKSPDMAGALDSVGAVAEDVRRGIMVSQDACQLAEKALTTAYFQSQGDAQQPQEQDRG